MHSRIEWLMNNVGWSVTVRRKSSEFMSLCATSSMNHMLAPSPTFTWSHSLTVQHGPHRRGLAKRGGSCQAGRPDPALTAWPFRPRKTVWVAMDDSQSQVVQRSHWGLSLAYVNFWCEPSQGHCLLPRPCQLRISLTKDTLGSNCKWLS